MDGPIPKVVPPTEAREWEVEVDGAWSTLPAEASDQLNAAVASGHKSCMITMKGNVYAVDLKVLRQTNTGTGVSRAIRSKSPGLPRLVTPPLSPARSASGGGQSRRSSGPPSPTSSVASGRVPSSPGTPASGAEGPVWEVQVGDAWSCLPQHVMRELEEAYVEGSQVCVVNGGAAQLRDGGAGGSGAVHGQPSCA